MDAIVSGLGKFATMREMGVIGSRKEGRRALDGADIGHEWNILVHSTAPTTEMGEAEPFDCAIRVVVATWKNCCRVRAPLHHTGGIGSTGERIATISDQTWAVPCTGGTNKRIDVLGEILLGTGDNGGW